MFSNKWLPIDLAARVKTITSNYIDCVSGLMNACNGPAIKGRFHRKKSIMWLNVLSFKRSCFKEIWIIINSSIQLGGVRDSGLNRV